MMMTSESAVRPKIVRSKLTLQSRMANFGKLFGELVVKKVKCFCLQKININLIAIKLSNDSVSPMNTGLFFCIANKKRKGVVLDFLTGQATQY